MQYHGPSEPVPMVTIVGLERRGRIRKSSRRTLHACSLSLRSTPQCYSSAHYTKCGHMPTAHKNTFIFLMPRSFQPNNCDRCSGAESLLHFTFSPPCTRQCMSAHTQNKGRAARARTHINTHTRCQRSPGQTDTLRATRHVQTSAGRPQPPGSPGQSGPWVRRTAQKGPR